LPKLRRMSGRDVREILRAHGFAHVRQKGSHMIMQRRLEDTTITVPVPDHSELHTGTLLSIIRQSKLPRELFET
jgi:predicted RNA binding protein YcfA (HicA-like mRNA interferase family)